MLKILSKSAVGLCGLALVGCTGYSITGGPGALLKSPLTTESSAAFEPLRYNDVLVFPLDVPVASSIPRELADKYTGSLVSALDLATGLEITNVHRGEQANDIIASKRSRAVSLKTKALEAAKDLNTQAVIFGVLAAFEPRDAKVKRKSIPSKAGFKLWMVDVSDGSELWSATYEKTEQPLSENVFETKRRLKEGLRFVPADTLLKDGFKEAAVKLESLRSQSSTR